MVKTVILGLMIPFIGTAAGSACVFFLKKDLKNQARADRICSGRDGRGVDLEPDRSCHRAVFRQGKIRVPSRLCWLLVWNTFPAPVRSRNSASSCRGRGPY